MVVPDNDDIVDRNNRNPRRAGHSQNIVRSLFILFNINFPETQALLDKIALYLFAMPAVRKCVDGDLMIHMAPPFLCTHALIDA